MNVNGKVYAARTIALTVGMALASAAHGQMSSANIGFAVATANNQVYIGGQVIGPIPPDYPYLGGDGDSFLQAFNQNGKLQWTAEFGSTAQDRVLGVAADATGVYAAGFTMGAMTGQTFYGSTDAYVAKFSLTGEPLWMNEFGGPGVERLQAAASDGTYLYVTGYTSEALYGLPFLGEQDCFAQKWDQNGNLIWTSDFGTTETDRCYGIAVNANGIFITGRTTGAFTGQTSTGYEDGMVVELNFNGDLIWVNQFGTQGPTRGWGVTANSTGVYVTGRTGGAFAGQPYLGGDDSYMAKFSYSGTMEWVNEFGTSVFDRGTDAATDATGIYGTGYTAGALPGNVSAGYDDCYLSKWSPSEKMLWTVQFGSSQNDQCWGVATDTTGAYVSGTAGGTLPGQTKGNGFFLEKFDTNGNSLWTREIAVPRGTN